MGMPQEVISPLSSLHGMYLRDQYEASDGIGLYTLEDDVAGEAVTGIERHDVVVREKRREGSKRGYKAAEVM